MSRKKANGGFSGLVLVFSVLVSSFLFVAGQDAKQINNPAALDIFSELLNNQIKNFTAIFKGDIKKNFGFCITDVYGFLHPLDCFNVEKNL
uniref:Uncharacterized protein n=1 Tax=Cannabis sativa TaxID=3483 RepID=A0A803PSS1_CANSA